MQTTRRNLSSLKRLQRRKLPSLRKSAKIWNWLKHHCVIISQSRKPNGTWSLSSSKTISGSSKRKLNACKRRTRCFCGRTKSWERAIEISFNSLWATSRTGAKTSCTLNHRWNLTSSRRAAGKVLLQQQRKIQITVVLCRTSFSNLSRHPCRFQNWLWQRSKMKMLSSRSQRAPLKKAKYKMHRERQSLSKSQKLSKATSQPWRGTLVPQQTQTKSCWPLSQPSP